jgi:hypothetical protein
MNAGDIVTIRRSDGSTMDARIFTCYDNHVKVIWLKNKNDDMYYFKNISKKEILELNPQYMREVITFQFSQEQIDAFQGCPDCPKIFFDAITN